MVVCEEGIFEGAEQLRISTKHYLESTWSYDKQHHYSNGEVEDVEACSLNRFENNRKTRQSFA